MLHSGSVKVSSSSSPKDTSTYSLRNTARQGRIRRRPSDPDRWKSESSMLLSRIPDSHKMRRRSSLVVYHASC